MYFVVTELSDSRLFLREFRQTFHTTGAVLPSGGSLARALARFVGGSDRPRRILEVGPGTGAVTRAIVRQMGADDRLDLVEANESFVARLREHFQNDPQLQLVAARTQIIHGRAECLFGEVRYDAIVSGLPFNNFNASEVKRILATLVEQLHIGGTLSFFEYIGVRRARYFLSRMDERVRLKAIGVALDEVLLPHEFCRERVWRNVPPAWVHHVRVADCV